MESGNAARALAALGHEGRLSAFRLLADAGPEGLPAGEVARRTGAMQNTSSGNLNILASVGLVISRREGRSIIYAVDHAYLVELLAYVVQDCCGGRPDLCAPFFARLARACNSDDPVAPGREGSGGACC